MVRSQSQWHSDKKTLLQCQVTQTKEIKYKERRTIEKLSLKASLWTTEKRRILKLAIIPCLSQLKSKLLISKESLTVYSVLFQFIRLVQNITANKNLQTKHNLGRLQRAVTIARKRFEKGITVQPTITTNKNMQEHSLHLPILALKIKDSHGLKKESTSPQFQVLRQDSNIFPVRSLF